MEGSARENPISQTEWKPLIICTAIPLAVGGLSALLTRDGMKAFAQLNQPPLSPPAWVFPVVWTLLFLMMGVASYLVIFSVAPRRTIFTALFVYGVQLIVNFFWSILFFNLGQFLTAFFWLVFLWLLIGATTIMLLRLVRKAGYLLLPYWAWVTFAGYLNYSVYLLNP